jgi:hypothetical protein
MRNLFSNIGIAIFAFITFVGLSFFALYHYQFFGTRFENARRQVFEQTQSYVEGKRQDLVRYRLQYQQAKDPAEQQAIRMMILESMANVDTSLFSYDLQDFLRSIQ